MKVLYNVFKNYRNYEGPKILVENKGVYLRNVKLEIRKFTGLRNNLEIALYFKMRSAKCKRKCFNALTNYS